MLTIANEYLNRYGAEDEAVAAFAADLMRGDPATLKQGYTRANAVIATAEAFDLSRERVEAAVPQ